MTSRNLTEPYDPTKFYKVRNNLISVWLDKYGDIKVGTDTELDEKTDKRCIYSVISADSSIASFFDYYPSFRLILDEDFGVCYMIDECGDSICYEDYIQILDKFSIEYVTKPSIESIMIQLYMPIEYIQFKIQELSTQDIWTPFMINNLLNSVYEELLLRVCDFLVTKRTIMINFTVLRELCNEEVKSLNPILFTLEEKVIKKYITNDYIDNVYDKLEISDNECEYITNTRLMRAVYDQFIREEYNDIMSYRGLNLIKLKSLCYKKVKSNNY